MDNEEVKPDEVKDEVVEEVAPSEQPVEEVKPDRPEINYQRELERKNRELEKARAELEVARTSSAPRRDPNDVSTWSDTELKAIASSNDPSVLPYKDQVNEVLAERRVKRVLEKERMDRKRATTEIELRAKYPEALDASSSFAAEMEQVMYDLDLQKSPAGRLAAAELVAARKQKGTASSTAAGRKKEQDRVRDVKAQLVEGDRPRPQDIKGPRKTEELEKKIRSAGITDASGVKEALDERGITRENFFKR